jgi:CBS domain-containing protein
VYRETLSARISIRELARAAWQGVRRRATIRPNACGGRSGTRRFRWFFDLIENGCEVGENQVVFDLGIQGDLGMKKGDVQNRRVNEFMTRDLVTVDLDDSVSDALQLMVENKVSAVPVVDGHERCVGVVSSSDLLQLALQFGGELDALSQSEGLDHQLLIERLEQTGFSSQSVRETMTHRPFTVMMEATLAEAAADMVRHRVHRLAVTDKAGKLIGLISTMDIARAVSES